MALNVLLSTTLRWPSTARLAAAFAKAGAGVEVLSPRGAPVRLSRFVDVNHLYLPAAPLAGLSAAIAASAPDLIVPCDDRAVAHLLRLHDEERGSAVTGLIARSLGAAQSYATLMARGDFLAAARGLGIATPETFAVANEAELESALARIGFPAVLKTDGSWGGDGVVVAHCRAEALAAFHTFAAPPSRLRDLARAFKRRDVHFALTAFHRQRPAISVQRFMNGHPATTSFACWNGTLLAAQHAEVVIAEDGTGPATVIRRTSCPQMQQAAERIASHFSLSGLHGLDFIRDAEGRVHLLESNPRATQLAPLVFAGGPDLVAHLAGAASNSLARARKSAIANDHIALFPQEWRRDPASPWLAAAHHDVPWDDPDVLVACLAPARRSWFERLVRAPAPALPFTSWKPSRP